MQFNALHPTPARHGEILLAIEFSHNYNMKNIENLIINTQRFHDKSI